MLNALAAIAACREAGLGPADAAAALATFPGAGRRFERRGTTGSGALVYDDYAHHPTEVRATIEAARTLDPERLIACFQPHLYSRTARLARDSRRRRLEPAVDGRRAEAQQPRFLAKKLDTDAFRLLGDVILSIGVDLVIPEAAQHSSIGAQARVRVDRLGAGHREKLAAAFVQLDAQAEERLEAPAEAAARAAHALRDRPDAPSVRRVEVEDAVGLAVADRAQDDGLGLDCSGHRKSLGPRAAAPRGVAPPVSPRPELLKPGRRCSWT